LNALSRLHQLSLYLDEVLWSQRWYQWLLVVGSGFGLVLMFLVDFQMQLPM
jgi:hypothetical protein